MTFSEAERDHQRARELRTKDDGAQSKRAKRAAKAQKKSDKKAAKRAAKRLKRDKKKRKAAPEPQAASSSSSSEDDEDEDEDAAIERERAARRERAAAAEARAQERAENPAPAPAYYTVLDIGSSKPQSAEAVAAAALLPPEVPESCIIRPRSPLRVEGPAAPPAPVAEGPARPPAGAGAGDPEPGPPVPPQLPLVVVGAGAVPVGRHRRVGPRVRVSKISKIGNVFCKILQILKQEKHFGRARSRLYQNLYNAFSM